MPISDRARKAMGDLGLTGYEIKGYLALVEFGPLVAADVSSQSGVPYSKIYDTLSNLEKKGWVEAEHSRPSKFYPRSPSTAIDTMRMKLESERRTSEKYVLNELSPAYEERGTKERPEIWIVKGGHNIISKVKESLQSCESELMISLPSGLSDLSESVIPVLIGIRERRVKIMVMVSEKLEGNSFDRLSRLADVRIRSTMFGGGLISDAREVILFLSPESEEGGSLAIWADHPGLASFAKGYFEYLWSSSKVR